MMTKFSMEAMIHSLKANQFIRSSNMIMGYVPGLPILTKLNGHLCARVPYLKYKVTGVVDKTFVLPIRYVVNLSLPEGTVIGFEDLSYNRFFANVNFDAPIGLFRHDAVKNLNKKAYSNIRSALFAEYDKVVRHLVSGDIYSDFDRKRFISQLNLVLEPSLIPFYSAIDREFVDKYIITD